MPWTHRMPSEPTQRPAPPLRSGRSTAETRTSYPGRFAASAWVMRGSCARSEVARRPEARSYPRRQLNATHRLARSAQILVARWPEALGAQSLATEVKAPAGNQETPSGSTEFRRLKAMTEFSGFRVFEFNSRLLFRGFLASCSIMSVVLGRSPAGVSFSLHDLAFAQLSARGRLRHGSARRSTQTNSRSLRT